MEDESREIMLGEHISVRPKNTADVLSFERVTGKTVSSLEMKSAGRSSKPSSSFKCADRLLKEAEQPEGCLI